MSGRARVDPLGRLRTLIRMDQPLRTAPLHPSLKRVNATVPDFQMERASQFRLSRLRENTSSVGCQI